MKIRKALITAANPRQRTLPLHTLIHRDGVQKSALSILLEEAREAGIEEFGIVVCPGDAAAYADAAGDLARHLHFIEQSEPKGYGHAVLLGESFVDNDPFLHLVGDHLHLSDSGESCARQLLEVAARENAAVSAVQPTREKLLGSYGAVGGKLLPGDNRLYEIATVLEKPTPTEAERRLLVPGLRAGFYLCFFGMHVLTPGIFEHLHESANSGNGGGSLQLSPALHQLAARQRYLAFAVAGRRFDIGAPYGLLFAQMALSLAGKDRDMVLTQMIELLANRNS